MLRPPPTTLFPYTTLFRSAARDIENRGPRRRSPEPGQALKAASPVPALLAGLWVCQADQAVKEVSPGKRAALDRKSTRLNSSHMSISYAVFCLKKKKKKQQ